MTDFRRPDLDLWDEEDDGEDQRPTIVSERPPAPSMPAMARMSLVQRLIAKGELEDTDDGRGGALQHKGHSGLPAASPQLLGQPKRPSRVPPRRESPIEAAARDAADALPDSTEILDERELDMLRLSEPPVSGAMSRSAPMPERSTTAVLEAAKPLGAPLPHAARRAPQTLPLGGPQTLPLFGSPPRRVEARGSGREQGVLVRGSAREQGIDARRAVHEQKIDARDSAREQDIDAHGAAREQDPHELRYDDPWQPGTELAASAGQPEMDPEDFVPTRVTRPDMDEEDFVPTRLARRPRTSLPAVQRVPPAILETPGFVDREITQRISIPPLASSIAPATHTVRPLGRPQKGMGGWQLALVATLLIGAGLGVARLRRESGAGASNAAAGSAASAAGVSPARELAAAPPAELAQEEPSQPPTEAVPAEPTLAPTEAPATAAAKPARRSRAGAPESSAAPAPALAAAEPGGEAQDAKSLPAASGAPAAGNLPLQPSREDVRTALNAVIPELQKCVGDQHGDADVTMVVRSQGVVSYAVVSGSFAGTPEGSCIARSVKLAKFPSFSAPSLRVTYPFSL